MKGRYLVFGMEVVCIVVLNIFVLVSMVEDFYSNIDFYKDFLTINTVEVASVVIYVNIDSTYSAAVIDVDYFSILGDTDTIRSPFYVYFI